MRRTRDDNLYFVIIIGNYDVKESFINALWNSIAGRYAKQTHMLDEIQNAPGLGHNAAPGVIIVDRSAHNTIRSKGPMRRCCFFSSTMFNSGAKVIQNIDALGPTVNWSNSAIAFHGYEPGGRNAMLACLLNTFGPPATRVSKPSSTSGRGRRAILSSASRLIRTSTTPTTTNNSAVRG